MVVKRFINNVTFEHAHFLHEEKVNVSLSFFLYPIYNLEFSKNLDGSVFFVFEDLPSNIKKNHHDDSFSVTKAALGLPAYNKVYFTSVATLSVSFILLRAK